MKRRRSSLPASKAGFVNAVSEVAAILTNAGSRYKAHDLGAQVIGLESLNDTDFENANLSIESLKSELKDSASFMTLLGGSRVPQDKLDFALESAAFTLLGGAAAQGYYAPENQKVAPLAGEGMVVTPIDGSTSYALESFDPMSSAKYLAATAVANAQAAVLGGFEDVWFPQQLVPAGQSGVDVQITIPRIMTTTPRASDNGLAYTINKTSLIEALIDPSYLESNATTIVPYASDATTPAYLVPNAQVPTTTRQIAGLDVTTRPIKFGVEVDAIQASNFPGLIAVGAFDETDSLDPIINIGTVYYKLTIDDDSSDGNAALVAYYAQDVSSEVGTLLTQVQAGRIQAYQTTAAVGLNLTEATVPVNGATKAQITAKLETILGIAADAKFTIVAKTKLSATADTEYANIEVNANSTAIDSWYDAAGNKMGTAAFAAANVVVTFEPIGYMPLMRRTNSNLRQNGTIIDSNTTKTYRYSVNLSAPIISQSPVNGATNTTLEGLGLAARIRQNGRAVTALANLESILANASGVPVQSPVAGAEFVTPTYIHKTIDVTSLVSSLNSSDNLINLRGALRSALTNMVNEALIKSRYPAALELTTGDPDAFEIIVATDQEIAPHLMVDGDVRTFGDGRRYDITKSNNKFFTGKIYASFRRSVRSDEIHPLDFGRMLVTPPLTYDVMISRNGRTTNEIHTIPRVNAYPTLPILLRLDVTGLTQIYVNA